MRVAVTCPGTRSGKGGPRVVLPQPSGSRESGARTGWGTRGGRAGSDAREGGRRNRKGGRHNSEAMVKFKLMFQTCVSKPAVKACATAACSISFPGQSEPDFLTAVTPICSTESVGSFQKTLRVTSVNISET